MRTVAALSVLLVASTCVANGAAGAQTLPTVPTVPASAHSIGTGLAPARRNCSRTRAPAAPAPSADIVGVTQQPFVGLSLQDAISMSLAKNTNLAVSQSNRRIAGYQIVAAQGAYDVRFQIQPSYDYQKSARRSARSESGPGNGPITQTTLGANGSLFGPARERRDRNTRSGSAAKASVRTARPTVSSHITSPRCRSASRSRCSKAVTPTRGTSSISRASTQIRSPIRRCSPRRRRCRTSRTRIGTSLPRGATSRSRRSRCAKRRSSPRATPASSSAAPRRPSTSSRPTRKSTCIRTTCCRRCRTSRRCRTN